MDPVLGGGTPTQNPGRLIGERMGSRILLRVCFFFGCRPPLGKKSVGFVWYSELYLRDEPQIEIDCLAVGMSWLGRGDCGGSMRLQKKSGERKPHCDSYP